MTKSKLDRLFSVEKPIIGMIHLAGEDPVKRALEEISIYENEGISGAIVENYHGSIENVRTTLVELSKRKNNIKIGVNILPNDFKRAFSWARDYMAAFIQLDHVAGKYDHGELNFGLYRHFRENFREIFVMGGVWPKYYTPVNGSNIERDLVDGRSRADSIVVTGEGTGKETPLEKIEGFRRILGDYPLIVGAGLTAENAVEQLEIADGAIVGSFFKKNNDTEQELDVKKIRELMTVVREIRKN